MQTKQHFLDYISQVKPILQNVSLGIEDLTHIEQNIAQAELIIPVVGGFSAGKSTLINAFLNTDLLPTGITPETALATELHYSEESYLESIDENGRKQRHPIEAIATIKNHAEQYQFTRLYLNNDALKNIEPLILVDMPGFDSANEIHHKTILNYLHKGCYFVFLTSIEDGNLTRSMIREINNLSHFAKDFSFCLSKTNLRSAQDVQQVQERIQEQLEDDFDFNKKVILLGENDGENLNEILQSIDAESLFHALFINALRDNYLLIIEDLNIIIKTHKSTTEQAEQVIAELSKGLERIQEQKNNEINKIKNNYSVYSVNSIIKKIIQQIHINHDNLVSFAMNSASSFQSEVQDIIQDTLLRELQEEFRKISQDIIKNFNLDLKQAFNHGEGFDFEQNDFIDRISQHSHNLLNRTQQGMDNWGNKLNEFLGGKYKAITTILGITTKILSPVVEVALIFLPEIINFFTQGKREQEKRTKISNTINQELIPQIKTKLKQELSTLFENSIEELIRNISHEFSEQIKHKQQEIERVTQEKQNKAIEVEKEITKLSQAKSEIEKLSNQYLFNS